MTGKRFKKLLMSYKAKRNSAELARKFVTYMNGELSYFDFYLYILDLSSDWPPRFALKNKKCLKNYHI